VNAGLTPWIVFIAAVATLLTIDLAVVGRGGKAMSTRSAYLWSALWITLGLSFSLAVWAWRGSQAAQEYLAGYLIEESLSIDNLFVFLLVFGSLGIALRYQRKVLFWGILGAVLMRALFIFAGIEALERFSWIMYVFGAVLIITAVRLVRSHDVQVDPQRNPLVRLTKRFLPVADDYVGSKFTVRRAGKLFLTPLAIALVAVESADLVFAIDSVPAVLAVTDDAFVAFTSNVAAILGLRALYFALAGSLQRFAYLSWGLAAVLAFVGAKMLLADVFHVPVYVSLAVIAVCVGASIVASLWLTRGGRGEPPPAAEAAAAPEPETAREGSPGS
jgi:tellurite resistance protein TerC